MVPDVSFLAWRLHHIWILFESRPGQCCNVPLVNDKYIALRHEVTFTVSVVPSRLGIKHPKGKPQTIIDLPELARSKSLYSIRVISSSTNCGFLQMMMYLYPQNGCHSWCIIMGVPSCVNKVMVNINVEALL